jgi:hypothetical protein
MNWFAKFNNYIKTFDVNSRRFIISRGMQNLPKARGRRSQQILHWGQF